MATATKFTDHELYSAYATAPTTSGHGILHHPDGLEVIWMVRPTTAATDTFTATPYYYSTSADTGSGAWVPGAQSTLSQANGFCLAQACTGDRVAVHVTAGSGSVADVSYAVRKLGR